MYCKFICKNIQKSMITFCSYVLLSFKKRTSTKKVQCLRSVIPGLDQGTCLNASTNACDKKNATYSP